MVPPSIPGWWRRARCSSHFPVSGPMATPTWPTRSPGELPRSSSRDRSPTRRRSATSRSSASPIRSPRSGRSPPAGAAGSTRWSSGVTGSIAKTSTKEAVAAVLGRRFRTLRNEGNQNNEVGLPLTLMRLGPEHEAAVLEMGMYTGGEIADLARIARPRIGVVTAVQPVHLSRIGSLEAIEAAKGELLEALPADGAAILNADDPIVRRMGTRSAARSVTYGFAADADVGAEAVESAGTAGMRFVLRTDAGSRPVTIPTLGRLSVHNALAGAAVGGAAGLSLDEIAAGLAAGWSAPHRVQLVRLGGVTIVDDSYNASPRSVVAALDLLAGLPGRRAAVLGEMLELGEASDEGHHVVGEAAARTVDWLVVVGPGAGGDRRRCAGGRDGSRPCRPGPRRRGRPRHAAGPPPRRRRRPRQGVARDRPGSRRRRPPPRPRPGRRHDDRRADPGVAAGVRPDGHPDVALHPAAPRARVRQADPPGGTREPLHQGRDADDGRPAHRGGRHRDLLLPAQRPGLGDLRAAGRAGGRRDPRRLRRLPERQDR